MLHAASESAAHALNRHRPAAAHAQQPSRPAGPFFASMLDESQAATAQAQASSAQTAPAEDNQPKPKAKAADKSPTSDTADAGKDSKAAAPSDKCEQSDKPACDNAIMLAPNEKTGDANTAEEIKFVQSAASQNGEPVDSDAKDAGADAAATVKAAAAAVAAASVPVDPTPVVQTPQAPAAVIAAPAAPLAPIADSNQAPQPSADAQALQLAINGKSAGDATLTAKTAAVHNGVKPQAPEAHDDAVAQARGESSERSTQASPTFDVPNSTPGADAPKAPAQFVQQSALPAPAQNINAAANAAVAAQQAPQAAAVPLSGVAVEIAGKAASGKNHFEIRLDPPELGRIEVRLSVDRDGNVSSRLIADRPDTLDLLRRDAGGLERALQDAGLKTSDNGLQFSLRDQSAYQQNQQQQGQPGRDAAYLVLEDELVPAELPRNYGRLAGLGGGLDIQV